MDWQTVLGWKHATGIMEVTAYGSARTSTPEYPNCQPMFS